MTTRNNSRVPSDEEEFMVILTPEAIAELDKAAEEARQAARAQAQRFHQEVKEYLAQGGESWD